MKTQTIEKFKIVGISIRTTNENGQAAKDIPALWQKFTSERILEKISNKVDNTIYCIYTDYEKDHTKPYTTILGCKVSDLDSIPTEMTGRSFNDEKYIKHTAKGNISQGIVFDEWMKIWNSDLKRKYSADIEIYGEKAQNPEQAEVDILIAIE